MGCCGAISSVCCSEVFFTSVGFASEFFSCSSASFPPGSIGGSSFNAVVVSVLL